MIIPESVQLVTEIINGLPVYSKYTAAGQCQDFMSG